MTERRSDTELLRAIMANMPSADVLWLDGQFLWTKDGGCEEYEQSDWFKFVAFSLLKILVRMRDEVGGHYGMIKDELPDD